MWLTLQGLNHLSRSGQHLPRQPTVESALKAKGVDHINSGQVDHPASIEQYGLLHPIILTATNVLVAGERRLRAFQSRNWPTIQARLYLDLTADERREIELEENIRRKDLSPLELSKNLVALGKTAKRVLLTNSKTPTTGRPAKSGVSEAKVAERVGVDRQVLRNAEAHVKAAETIPALSAPTLPQSHVLGAARLLSLIPEADREAIKDMRQAP